jgi:adenylate cyclase class 2
MAQEIEVKFLNINHDDIRAKLKELGAKLKSPKTLYRRINLDFDDGRLAKIGGWVRLRDEGDKITLTHKIHKNNSSGELEISEFEVVVDDFDSTKEFLESLGMLVKTYQENYRENWLLNLESGSVEVALDQWPHVKPHIELELESGNPRVIKQACKLLNLNYENALNDDICPVYIEEYYVSDRTELYNLKGGFRFDTPIELKRRA